MRATVLSEIGGPLVIEEIPRPDPQSGEVLVRVVACGVCHTDLHVIKGEVTFPLPAVLGHEISGVMERLGPGVSGVKPGDPVVCSFIMPCGTCEYCARGRDDLCETFFSSCWGFGILTERVGLAFFSHRHGLGTLSGTPLDTRSLSL